VRRSPPGAGRGLSRRQLLRLTALGAAGGATLGAAREAHAFRLLRRDYAVAHEREVPSFCELCFWSCGVKARVKGNRVLSLRGHEDYPNAMGRLCGRGNAGAAFLADADRLKHPMVRVGERGEGRFERVGWKTAYRHIARGFARIRERYGPEALALFYHGAGGPMLRTMMEACGTPNFAAPSYAQCKAARDVGYALTFGEKLASPEPLDFERTRCMVLFGSHLGENTHNRQVQEFVEARARGASLIVLDPRLSTVAARADVWMPVRPGSDLAIILAWIHLLIEDDAYDKAFIEAHAAGLDKLIAHVRPFTPAWAAAAAGVAESQIRAAYEHMRAAMPAVLVHPGRHTAWYGEADTQRARGQAILTALLGAWWRPGGVFRAEAPSLRDFPGPDFPDLKPHVDATAGRYPFAQEVTTNGIREATRTGAPYPIKGWFVHGSNLIQSLPNVAETVEAIAQLDLLVVCDVMPSDITRYADVLLPEDLYLERHDDLLRGATKQPFIGLRQPAVTSPHDTRPAWRIAKELGAELGVGDFFAFDSFGEYLEARLEGSGVTLAQLEKAGVHPVARQTPPYLEPDEAPAYHTPTGRVELYSQPLADAGFAPLPVYEPQPRPPEGSLRLLYGRSPLHTFGRTQNNRVLSDLVPGNCVWMNPRCAAGVGVEHGQPVMIRNADGRETGPLPVRATERMPERAVYMVHGFGHQSPGLSRACCVGGSDAEVITRYVTDPISGGTGMRTQFVTIHPVTRTTEAIPCDMR
jgi:thiosulfate reductase / polysulfide reductase chain A